MTEPEGESGEFARPFAALVDQAVQFRLVSGDPIMDQENPRYEDPSKENAFRTSTREAAANDTAELSGTVAALAEVRSKKRRERQLTDTMRAFGFTRLLVVAAHSPQIFDQIGIPEALARSTLSKLAMEASRSIEIGEQPARDSGDYTLWQGRIREKGLLRVFSIAINARSGQLPQDPGMGRRR